MHNKLLNKLGFLSFLGVMVCSNSVMGQSVARPAKPQTLPPAAAVSVAVIKNINVIGQKKIEKEAIIAKLVSQVGKAYSEKNVTLDIQALFKMGYFVQVEVSQETTNRETTLEYRVVEKPTISEITFEGNSELKSEELETQSALKAFEILNNTKIKEAVTKLEKFYEEKGFYLVKIEPVIEEVKKDETARIKFLITENDKVKVRKITFIGNNKLKIRT